MPKTHFELQYMMDLYSRYRIDPFSPEIKNKVIQKLNFDNRKFKNHKKHKCDLCYSEFFHRPQLYKHIWKHHDKDNIGQTNPFVWLQDQDIFPKSLTPPSPDHYPCPLGCPTHLYVKKPRTLHLHLILFHSHQHLASW